MKTKDCKYKSVCGILEVDHNKLLEYDGKNGHVTCDASEKFPCTINICYK